MLGCWCCLRPRPTHGVGERRELLQRGMPGIYTGALEVVNVVNVDVAEIDSRSYMDVSQDEHV